MSHRSFSLHLDSLPRVKQMSIIICFFRTRKCFQKKAGSCHSLLNQKNLVNAIPYWTDHKPANYVMPATSALKYLDASWVHFHMPQLWQNNGNGFGRHLNVFPVCFCIARQESSLKSPSPFSGGAAAAVVPEGKRASSLKSSHLLWVCHGCSASWGEGVSFLKSAPFLCLCHDCSAPGRELKNHSTMQKWSQEAFRCLLSPLTHGMNHNHKVVCKTGKLWQFMIPHNQQKTFSPSLLHPSPSVMGTWGGMH